VSVFDIFKKTKKTRENPPKPDSSVQVEVQEHNKEVFKADEDIFSGYIFYATLDTRTCLVCASLDGKTFKTQEEAPTAHCLNKHCRCVLSPEVEGFEGMESTRASMDGPVPGNWTYEIWLNKQPASIKKEILGEYYKLYRAGASLEEIAKTAQQG
jgi:hypothetical protein